MKRRFSASSELHGERAKGTIREIRRLERLTRSNLAAGDCVRAAGLMVSLAQQEGAYWIDRHESRGTHVDLPSVSRLLTRFTQACIRPKIGRR